MAITFQLPNGIKAACEERPGSGKVFMGVWFKSGTAHEPPDEKGLTFLTLQSLKFGTTTRTEQELAEDIESCGSPLDTMNVNLHNAHVYAMPVTRHAARAFAALADAVRNPVLDDASVFLERKRMVSYLGQTRPDPAEQAGFDFLATAFSGQDIGAETALGTAETAAALTPEQVRRRHVALLSHPENLVLSFSGDITAAEAQRLAARYFGDLSPTAAPFGPVHAAFTPGDRRTVTDDAQTNIQLGFRVCGEQDPGIHALKVLRPHLASVLMEEVREKRGLVYDVKPVCTLFAKDGVLSIEAGTSPEKNGTLVATVLDVIGGLARDGMSPAQIRRVRDEIASWTKRKEVSVYDAGAENGYALAYLGVLVDAKANLAGISAVTPDDIRRLAGRMLDGGRYALAAVGPAGTLPAPDEIGAMMRAQMDGVQIPAPARKAPLRAVFGRVMSRVRAAFDDAARTPGSYDAAPEKTVLPNGLTVITLDRPGALTVFAAVGTGSNHETPEQNGLRHAMEHMMAFRGSVSYPPYAISRIVHKELDGNLNASAGKEDTRYYISGVAPAALEKSIDMLGDMVFRTTFDAGEFDGNAARPGGERAAILEEYKGSLGQNMSVRRDAADAFAYAGQPHARTVLGTEESIRALTVAQMARDRDTFYVPNNVVIAVAGNAGHADVVKIVARKYGARAPGPVPPLPVPVLQGGTHVVEKETGGHCLMSLSLPAAPLEQPESMAYYLLSRVFGGATSARLGRMPVSCFAAREYGQVSLMPQGPAARVREDLAWFYDSIRAPVTQKELENAKVQAELTLSFRHEDNLSAARHLATDTLYCGRLMAPGDFKARIDGTTLEDVRRAAEKLLAAEPSVVMMVPPGTDRALLPTHAEILALRGPGSGRP